MLYPSAFGFSLLIIIPPLLRTDSSPPLELCDSPHHAAHYHIFGFAGFVSGAPLGRLHSQNVSLAHKTPAVNTALAVRVLDAASFKYMTIGNGCSGSCWKSCIPLRYFVILLRRPSRIPGQCYTGVLPLVAGSTIRRYSHSRSCQQRRSVGSKLVPLTLDGSRPPDLSIHRQHGNSAYVFFKEW